MNRFYQGDWIDSMASRFIDELPEKYIEKILFLMKEKMRLMILNLIKILIQRMNTEVLDGLDIKKGLNDKKIIRHIRNQFKKLDIDGYVVPKNDEFFSEYSKKDRLKIVSNF